MRLEIRGSPEPPLNTRVVAVVPGDPPGWEVCLEPHRELSFCPAELLSVPPQTRLHLWPQPEHGGIKAPHKVKALLQKPLSLLLPTTGISLNHVFLSTL